MNILLSSVGRRPYLVRWFKEALLDNGFEGKVIAADFDPYSPSKAFADEFLIAPRVTDPSYADWLFKVLDERKIDLAISINDFELSKWSTLVDNPEAKVLVTLTPEIQSLVEDKFAMSEKLIESGIHLPATWLATDSIPVSLQETQFVTKGRYGSASRGLRFADSNTLEDAIKSALTEVTTPSGELAIHQDEIDPREFVVVQQRITGIEYGLDIICDLRGSYKAVLAREKLAMRGGETDRAVSAGAIEFETLASRVATAIPHPGSVDVDVMVDADSQHFLIDVNPRLGGGYPFSHLAGARVPSAYVAWAAGERINEDWLSATPGIVGGKHIEAVSIP